MANFVRAESVVRDAVNFCADSDVIEVSMASSRVSSSKRSNENSVDKKVRQ